MYQHSTARRTATHLGRRLRVARRAATTSNVAGWRPQAASVAFASPHVTPRRARREYTVQNTVDVASHTADPSAAARRTDLASSPDPPPLARSRSGLGDGRRRRAGGGRLTEKADERERRHPQWEGLASSTLTGRLSRINNAGSYLRKRQLRCQSQVSYQPQRHLDGLADPSPGHQPSLSELAIPHLTIGQQPAARHRVLSRT